MRLTWITVTIIATTLAPKPSSAAQRPPLDGLWITRLPEDSIEGVLIRFVKADSAVIRLRERCTNQTRLCEYLPTIRRYQWIDSGLATGLVTGLTFTYRTEDGSFRVVEATADTARLLRVVRRAYALRDSSPGVETFQFLRRREVATVNGHSDPFPAFPWPPPEPSDRLQVPDSLLRIGPDATLGSIFDRLTMTLQRVEPQWWSVYSIGDSGFALITRLEAIESDGTPKAGDERWRTARDRVPRRISGFVDYLKALFGATPGRYRVIAFAVTARSLTFADSTISAEEAEVLGHRGSDRLPAEWRARRLGADGRCVALIYEFERPSDDSPTRIVRGGTTRAWQHLMRAGLWTEQELRQ